MLNEKKLDEMIEEEIKKDPIIGKAINYMQKKMFSYFLSYFIGTSVIITSGNYFTSNYFKEKIIENNLENKVNKTKLLSGKEIESKENRTEFVTKYEPEKSKYIEKNKKEIEKKKEKKYKKKRKINKEILRQTEIYKEGIIIPFQENESLSLVSLYYTGDMFKWKEFININYADNFIIKNNPSVISPGEKLYIPKKYLKKEIKNYFY